MKANKLLFALCAMAFIFGLSISTPAQQGGAATPPDSSQAGAPEVGRGAGGAGMDADTPENDPAMNLTDDQKTKIKAIRDDAKDQAKALKKDASLSDEQRQQKMKQVKMDTRKQVWAVMTPEQQKTWAQEQRERRQAKHMSDAPGAAPQR
jgi:Spy/CpxP family protein refolding chaperone